MPCVNLRTPAVEGSRYPCASFRETNADGVQVGRIGPASQATMSPAFTRDHLANHRRIRQISPREQRYGLRCAVID